MNKLNEDYTAGVLTGFPIFCINRLYKTVVPVGGFIKIQYIFRFENNYGASIIEFVDRRLSGGRQYELGVLEYTTDSNGNLSYDTDVSPDIERGSDRDMHELLCRIEKL